jgi:hypothetical protein
VAPDLPRSYWYLIVKILYKVYRKDWALALSYFLLSDIKAFPINSALLRGADARRSLFLNASVCLLGYIILQKKNCGGGAGTGSGELIGRHPKRGGRR